MEFRLKQCNGINIGLNTVVKVGFERWRKYKPWRAKKNDFPHNLYRT